MEERVVFELTKKQTDLLAEFFKKNEKEQGAIIGQIMESPGCKGYIVAGYMNRAETIAIQKALRVPKGKKTPGSHLVYTDLG